VDAVASEGATSDSPTSDLHTVDGWIMAPFSAPQPVTALNTEESEDDPMLTGDMLEIYFERSGDIWRATRSSTAESWSAPQPVAELNTVDNVDATPGISSAGLLIFLDSTRTHSSAKGKTDLYVASRSRRGDPFSTPQPVVELNSAESDVCAYPLPDKLTLVMDSNRPGGLGMRDLYTSTRSSSTAVWDAPVPIAGVSSSEHDQCPWVDPTFTVLYFASQRPGGAGSSDIWVTTRPKGGTFSPPETVKGINTDSSESDPWISPDQRTIYFSSNRDGNPDIFIATR
jgi:hypothetical protein